jgi:hypothetical protein
VRHECDNREFQVVRDDEWTMADDLGDGTVTVVGQRVDWAQRASCQCGNTFVPDGR